MDSVYFLIFSVSILIVGGLIIKDLLKDLGLKAKVEGELFGEPVSSVGVKGKNCQTLISFCDNKTVYWGGMCASPKLQLFLGE